MSSNPTKDHLMQLLTKPRLLGEISNKYHVLNYNEYTVDVWYF